MLPKHANFLNDRFETVPMGRMETGFEGLADSGRNIEALQATTNYYGFTTTDVKMRLYDVITTKSYMLYLYNN